MMELYGLAALCAFVIYLHDRLAVGRMRMQRMHEMESHQRDVAYIEACRRANREYLEINREVDDEPWKRS